MTDSPPRVHYRFCLRKAQVAHYNKRPSAAREALDQAREWCEQMPLYTPSFNARLLEETTAHLEPTSTT